MPGLLLTALLPLASALAAGRSANLVLCPDDASCADQLMWLDGLPDLDDAPLQLAEAMLELDTGGWDAGEPLEDRFRDAVARARSALAERHWVTADAALEEAERCLERWAGTVPNQELVEVAYLRGVAGLGQGEELRARQSFERGAVLAWNRSVDIPHDDLFAREVWYAVQGALLAGGTGRLRIGGATEAALSLDGVPLGPPPMELVVFPGRHRLTARDAGRDLDWKRDVIVHEGRTTTVWARFDRSGDARWVVERLLEVVRGEPAPTEVLDLLADWGARHGVQRIRLLQAEPIPDRPAGSPAYLLREVDFDPLLRRMEAP